MQENNIWRGQVLVCGHLGTSLTLQSSGVGCLVCPWMDMEHGQGHGMSLKPLFQECSSHPGLLKGLYCPTAVLYAWRKHVGELVERDKYSFSSP